MSKIPITYAVAMENFGSTLAIHCCPGSRVFLTGELGTGKTTLARGFLHQLGYHGIVKSPSYTLVESYQINDLEIFHFDLYRINDPQELLHIGIQEYFSDTSICLIEWPEKAPILLGLPDLHITIEYDEDQQDQRILQLVHGTAKGAKLLDALQKDYAW